MAPQTSDTSPDYKITEGANGTWTQNSGGTLRFAANGDLSKFTGVQVDGKLLTADQYTAASGSTVVTLKASYLTTLSAGKHTLTVVYTDGDCSTEFELQSAGNTDPGNNDKPGNNTAPAATPIPQRPAITAASSFGSLCCLLAACWPACPWCSERKESAADPQP